MHCSTRLALRLAASQTLLVRANPARPVSLVSGQSVRFLSDTTDREGKYLKKKKVSEKKAARKAEVEDDDAQVEEAGHNITSLDETAPLKVLNDLRHQHKSPIPRFDEDNAITEHEVKQREVVRRKEQMDEKKREILTRVKHLNDIVANEVVGERAQFASMEEAYQSMKFQFDGAILDRNANSVYDAILVMRKYGYRLPKKAYDDAAILFAEEQHIYKVKDVWNYMQRDQVYPDQQSFMNVFTIYCQMAQYEWAMKTFFLMCESLCPTAEAYEQALELFAKNNHVGNLRKSEKIFHTIHRFDLKHTPRACAAFIRALCASGYEGDGDRAIDVLKYMKLKVIEPVTEDVPKYFIEHIKKFAFPGHQFIRAKKVLRGCQHGGLPDEPFKALWDVVESKPYVKTISRADLAPPMEKMDLSIPPQTPGLRLG